MKEIVGAHVHRSDRLEDLAGMTALSLEGKVLSNTALRLKNVIVGEEA